MTKKLKFLWLLMKLKSLYLIQAFESHYPLTLNDRAIVTEFLLDYHLMVKVKAEMDQFKEGLSALGFLDNLMRNPSIWEPYFLALAKPLTAGMHASV